MTEHEHQWMETGRGFICECGKYVVKWEYE